MKSKIFAFLIIINCFFLASCNPYADKYPTNYTDSKWECTNPNITYYGGNFKNNISNYAEVIIDEKSYYFGLGFCATTADGIKYTLDENGDMIDTGEHYFLGTGKYGKNKFTIKIDKDSDKLFGGKYDKLIFQRVYE